MEPAWLRHSRNGATIVFVHGILSGPITAWRAESGAFWPRLVIEDDGLKEFGVYLYAYRADALAGTYSLEDAVDAMRDYFRLDGILDDKSNRLLIFICHSMGGILARRFAVANQLALAAHHTRLAYFLVASPSLGAQYANFVAAVAPLYSAQLEALRFSQKNQWLNTLDKDFLNLKEGRALLINGRELIEDQFAAKRSILKFPQIVPPWAGAKYFGNPIKIPRSDHISIAKPSGPDDFQHRLLVEFVGEVYKEWISQRSDTAPVDVPDRPLLVDWSTLLREDAVQTVIPPAKRDQRTVLVVAGAGGAAILLAAGWFWFSGAGPKPMGQPFLGVSKEALSKARVVVTVGPHLTSDTQQRVASRLGDAGIVVSGFAQFNGRPNAPTSELVYYNDSDERLAKAIQSDLDQQLENPIEVVKGTTARAKDGVIDLFLDRVRLKK